MTDLKDLGWDNEGGKTSERILEALKNCRSAGHMPSDTDHSISHNGADHWVRCGLCGYIYHYDSSD